MQKECFVHPSNALSQYRPSTSMFARTLVVFTFVAAALAAPAPQAGLPDVDVPVSISVPILSGNTGGNSYVPRRSCAKQKASSDVCFSNTVLPISLPIVTGLPLLGGLRRRQAGLPVGSVVGLVGTVDSALKNVVGDVVGILNGPLWYVAVTTFLVSTSFY